MPNSYHAKKFQIEKPYIDAGQKFDADLIHFDGVSLASTWQGNQDHKRKRSNRVNLDGMSKKTAFAREHSAPKYDESPRSRRTQGIFEDSCFNFVRLHVCLSVSSQTFPRQNEVARHHKMLMSPPSSPFLTCNDVNTSEPCFLSDEDTLISPRQFPTTSLRCGGDTVLKRALLPSATSAFAAVGSFSQNCKGSDVNSCLDNFGDVQIHTHCYTKWQRMSPLYEIIIGERSDMDWKKIAILGAFSNESELSMSQLMKFAALTDTKKNRALLNSLICDGDIILTGRSRSTRYRLAAN